MLKDCLAAPLKGNHPDPERQSSRSSCVMPRTDLVCDRAGGAMIEVRQETEGEAEVITACAMTSGLCSMKAKFLNHAEAYGGNNAKLANQMDACVRRSLVDWSRDGCPLVRWRS